MGWVVSGRVGVWEDRDRNWETGLWETGLGRTGESRAKGSTGFTLPAHPTN